MQIQKLKIFSKHIEAQLKFYRDELGFEIRNYSEKSFEIICGYSTLKIAYHENPKPYHIAFHIPDLQEEEALSWLERLVPVLKNNGEKIIDFDNWKAKSIYFYDEDRNILELISRKKFSKPQSAIFNPEQIVGIAEIGMVTGDVQKKFETLKMECGLNQYDGDLEKFCAIGEDSGLFITIDQDKKEWFPTGDKSYSADFEMEFSHKSNKFKLVFENDSLQIKNL